MIVDVWPLLVRLLSWVKILSRWNRFTSSISSRADSQLTSSRLCSTRRNIGHARRSISSSSCVSPISAPMSKTDCGTRVATRSDSHARAELVAHGKSYDHHHWRHPVFVFVALNLSRKWKFLNLNSSILVKAVRIGRGTHADGVTHWQIMKIRFRRCLHIAYRFGP